MKQIISILFRRKKEAGIFALCMILFPMSIAYMVTPKYKSSAVVMVTPGRFKKPFLPNEKNSQTGFVQITMEDVSTEVEIMLSRSVVEKVVSINHLDVFPAPSEDEHLKRALDASLKMFNQFLIFIKLKSYMTDYEVAVEKFIGDVDIDYVKRTNVIEIEWKGYTPEQAQNVVNTLIKEYTKQHLKVFGYSEALDVIKKDIDVSLDQISTIQGQFQELKAKKKFHEIDKERSATMDDYLEAKSRYESLLNIDPNNVIDTHNGLYGDDPNMVELINKLTAAKLRGIDLVAKYGNEDIKTKSNLNTIAQLASSIKSNHLNNVQIWQKKKSEYETKLLVLNEAKVEFDELNRKLNQVTDRYQINTQKYNEALISKEMDEANIASIRLVQPASYSGSPGYPNKMLLLFISLFFAIFGGIATAFAVEKTSSKFVRASDIESLTGLHVLFSVRFFKQIPQIDKNKFNHEMNQLLFAIDKFVNKESRLSKVSLLISPSSDVGASFLAAEMCKYTSSQTLLPTLLISLTYQNTSESYKLFKLGDVLSDVSKNIVKNSSYDGLNIVVTRDDILRVQLIETLVENLKKLGYANIFIDIPNEPKDYSFLSFMSSTDCVYIVVGYNLTDKSGLTRMLNVINEQTDIKPVGCILNKNVEVVPEFIYKRL